MVSNCPVRARATSGIFSIRHQSLSRTTFCCHAPDHASKAAPIKLYNLQAYQKKCGRLECRRKERSHKAAGSRVEAGGHRPRTPGRGTCHLQRLSRRRHRHGNSSRPSRIQAQAHPQHCHGRLLEASVIRQSGAAALVGPTPERLGSLETNNASVENTAILVQAGVPVALMTGLEGYVPRIEHCCSRPESPRPMAFRRGIARLNH